MVKESQVEYFVKCITCKNEYTVITYPKNDEDWARIQKTIGKELGWCTECTGYGE